MTSDQFYLGILIHLRFQVDSQLLAVGSISDVNIGLDWSLSFYVYLISSDISKS